MSINREFLGTKVFVDVGTAVIVVAGGVGGEGGGRSLGDEGSADSKVTIFFSPAEFRSIVRRRFIVASSTTALRETAEGK